MRVTVPGAEVAEPSVALKVMVSAPLKCGWGV